MREEVLYINGDLFTVEISNNNYQLFDENGLLSNGSLENGELKFNTGNRTYHFLLEENELTPIYITGNKSKYLL